MKQVLPITAAFGLQLLILAIHEIQFRRLGLSYDRLKVVGYCTAFFAIIVAQILKAIPDLVAYGLCLAVLVAYVATGGPWNGGGGRRRRRGGTWKSAREYLARGIPARRPSEAPSR